MTHNRFTTEEAIDILAQCSVLRASIDELIKEARKCLLCPRPELKLVKTDEEDDGHTV